MDRMSSRQLSAWMAYDSLEPFGEAREDLRAGIIASTIVNVRVDPKKGKYAKPQDFMPQFDEADEDLTPEEEQRLLHAKIAMVKEMFAGVGKQQRGRSKSGDTSQPSHEAGT